MTAPTVERTTLATPAPAEPLGEAFGLALLWLIPVLGFLLAVLGLR